MKIMFIISSDSDKLSEEYSKLTYKETEAQRDEMFCSQSGI